MHRKNRTPELKDYVVVFTGPSEARKHLVGDFVERIKSRGAQDVRVFPDLGGRFNPLFEAHLRAEDGAVKRYADSLCQDAKKHKVIVRAHVQERAPE